jgi:peptidoglycan/LPS O-acetylase OafA/YrhL
VNSSESSVVDAVESLSPPEPIISSDVPAHRLHFVDGMRAWAALWVLAFHSWAFAFSKVDQTPGWFALPFSAGHLGVPIFLVLSGFCLALPYVNSGKTKIDVRRFAIRRAVRILPPYWIWTLVFASLALLQTRLGLLHVQSVQQVTDANDVLWHLALIQNLSANHFFRINGALWSVALECQLYIVFPLLMLLWKRPSALLAICALTSLAAWIYAVQGHYNPGVALGMVVWASPLSYLVVFGLGMAAAVWFRHDAGAGKKWSGCALAGLVLSAILDRQYPAYPVLAVTMAAFAAVCVLLGGGDSPLGVVLKHPMLVKIGWVSYTLYLIHNPIVSFAGKLLRPRLHGLALAGGMLVFAAIAILLALLLFPILEQPFHRLAKRLASNTQAAS